MAASETPPKYTPAVLNKPAEYGVLKQLEGTWVNYNPKNTKMGWGLQTICMPSPGSNSETLPGKFHFLCNDYIEKLTFTLVEGGVRNRGGTNEQFCGAVKYDQSITNLDKVGIHEENGMYLWLDEIYNHPATKESIETDVGYPQFKPGTGANGPNFVPNYSIARSGVIPHGSTIQIFGKHSEHNGKPPFPHGDATWDFDHLAISPSMGGAGASAKNPINLDEPVPANIRDNDPHADPDSNITYTQRIFLHDLYPYSVRPDLRLRDAIANQDVQKYTLIEMHSREDGGPQGGILNDPFVRRFTPVTEMNFRMWIEEVKDGDDTFLQLQYEQIQYFEFHFGDDGGTTRWPHIQINTLRRQEDVEKMKIRRK
jgi:hypothetical protein